MIITVFLLLFVNDWTTCTNISTEISINIFMLLSRAHCIYFVKKIKRMHKVKEVIEFSKTWPLKHQVLSYLLVRNTLWYKFLLQYIFCSYTLCIIIIFKKRYWINHFIAYRDQHSILNEKWYLVYQQKEKFNNLDWRWCMGGVWKISQTDNMYANKK